MPSFPHRTGPASGLVCHIGVPHCCDTFDDRQHGPGQRQDHRRCPAHSPRPHPNSATILRPTSFAAGGSGSNATAQITAAIEAEWRKLLVGSDAAPIAEASFATALANAQSLGVTYMPASDIAASRLDDILARIERLAMPLPEVARGRPAGPAPSTVTAVLGGAGKPELRLSNLVESYEKLAADQTIGKSERQLHRWKTTHLRSVETLMQRIGDKCLKSAGLRPTAGHTVYSLRHTFKDRMIAVGVPERLQDELMGHTLKGMPYGNGATLKHRAEWTAKIWV
jgi:hypothetical protein